jgi:hypothetical protein
MLAEGAVLAEGVQLNVGRWRKGLLSLCISKMLALSVEQFRPTPQLFPFVNRLGHDGNRPEILKYSVSVQWDAKTVIYVK